MALIRLVPLTQLMLTGKTLVNENAVYQGKLRVFDRRHEADVEPRVKTLRTRAEEIKKGYVSQAQMETQYERVLKDTLGHEEELQRMAESIDGIIIPEGLAEARSARKALSQRIQDTLRFIDLLRDDIATWRNHEFEKEVFKKTKK